MSISRTISALIATTYFTSRVEAYRNEFRANPSSWYAQMPDKAQAEVRLAEWANLTVGESLEAIARSVAKLDEFNPGQVVNITNCQSRHSSDINEHPRHKFVAFGPWWVDGGLPLYAIILEAGYSSIKHTAKVTLVHPVWSGPGHLSRGEGDLAFITLDPTGQENTTLHHPYVETGNGGKASFTDTTASLKYILGMEAPSGILVSTSSDSLDGVLGFPKAKRVVIEALPGLHKIIR